MRKKAQPANPAGDGPFRSVCVRSEWLTYRLESAWSGSLAAPTPRTPGCCGHSRSALHFAASSTVQHLRFKAVCWRRVRGRTRLAALVSGSSFVLNPILSLRKPDAQSEIAPQRLHPAWHSRWLHSSCASTSFPPRPAVFAALRGIVAVSLGHTPASVAILRSLACASPPVAIARAQHPAWNKFKARCCRI